MKAYKKISEKDKKDITDDETKAISSLLVNINLVHEPWILNAIGANNLYFE